MNTETFDKYVDQEFDRFLGDLVRLLEQPSISATGEGVTDCVILLTELIHEYNFDKCEVIETDGQPAIIAQAFVGHDPLNDCPTVLVYGHYDVQPVTPSNWTTPPFEPTFKEDDMGAKRLYARGVGDNKGQFFCHLCAVQTLFEQDRLPLNITLLLEGEEEIGSPNLDKIVRENSDKLAANIVFNADGPMEQDDTPEINLGTRGLLYLDITANGPDNDLHSGNYGGPIPNPLWGMTHLLGSMKNTNGVVTINGFYDNVRQPSEKELMLCSEIPYSDNELLLQ